MKAKIDVGSLGFLILLLFLTSSAHAGLLYNLWEADSPEKATQFLSVEAVDGGLVELKMLCRSKEDGSLFACGSEPIRVSKERLEVLAGEESAQYNRYYASYLQAPKQKQSVENGIGISLVGMGAGFLPAAVGGLIYAALKSIDSPTETERKLLEHPKLKSFEAQAILGGLRDSGAHSTSLFRDRDCLEVIKAHVADLTSDATYGEIQGHLYRAVTEIQRKKDLRQANACSGERYPDCGDVSSPGAASGAR